MARRVKIAIVGAGTAGLEALSAVRRSTEDVVLIEGGPYGTTCARVGCMPSKLLIAAAGMAESVRNAPKFGVKVPKPEVDGAAVMKRVNAWRDHFVSGIVEDVEAMPDAMKVRGYARFQDDNTLTVRGDDGEETIEAERIVIATGSRPTMPDRYADLQRALTTDDLFGWTSLPQSIAVFGGGIIGLEIGQALSHLGVRTKLFGKDGLVGPLTDARLLQLARDHFTSTMEFVPHFDEDQLSEFGRRRDHRLHRER